MISASAAEMVDIQIDERHPESTSTAVTQRFGRSSLGHGFRKPDDYTIGEERFAFAMPDETDGQQPYGVLVWISCNEDGAVPADWVTAALERDLIVIGAHAAGNDRQALQRIGLALDAIHYCQSHYAIDDTRIYVAGLSGGGRCASMLAQTYPDVVTGCVAMCGVNYHRRLGRTPAVFAAPTGERRDQVLNDVRWVLLTGSEDYNREETEKVYRRGFQADSAAWVRLMVVPGMGHVYPSAQEVAIALHYLDDPERDPEQAYQDFLAAKAAARADAQRQAERATAQADERAAEFDRLFRSLQTAVFAHEREQAQELMQEMRETFPDHPRLSYAESIHALLVDE